MTCKITDHTGKYEKRKWVIDGLTIKMKRRKRKEREKGREKKN